MGPQEEYIETVFTCEGNFYDPNLHARLEQFHRGLKDLLLTDKQKLVLKKVEPWNSVRVTFNIPRDAAIRLKQLAQQGHVALRELGVLAVQIEGDQLISLTIAGHNNERTELVFKTSSSHSATMSTPLYEQIQFGASKERSGNVPPVPSSKKDVSKFISPGLADSILNPSIPASEVFRSPNVVASSCEPIPFRPNSVINTVPFSRCSTTTTTSALPPGRSPTGYPASQSQGLLSGPGTSRSPISQPGLKFPSPPNLPHASTTTRASVSPVSLPPPPPYPHTTAATTTTTTVNNVPRMCKPVTSSSPLLVNLLQTDATSVPFNNLTSSKMLPPPDASPPKRKRRQRKVKETKNSGAAVTGTVDEHSTQNIPSPAFTMYNISTTMVTSSTNTLSTSAVNPSILSAPNVTCPNTAFNPKASSTVSAKSQNPESLLVKENVLVDHRKSNVTTNIQQSSIGKPVQISTALSKESSGGGKLINPHTGHLEPVDEGSPSRSESLQHVNPIFENQLISGELFGGMKTKLPVNSQESESGSPKTSSPCPNSLPNKNAYICDSLGHHNSITLIKSTGCSHVQQGNSKEQMSPSVGLNGQNLFAPSKPCQNVSNSAVAAFHSSYTKDLNKLFAPESKLVPNTSAPHHMSGGEMVISKTSNMSQVDKPETGQLVTKKSITGQGSGGRKQRKSCANNASKTSKAERHSTTWGSDKHNVPFYKNFSDKSNPSGAGISSSATPVSAMIQQNAAKASSQGKFAGVEKQDRLASNDNNSVVSQRDAAMTELNQILESPESSKIASLSDAESENSNQSSITGSVPVVSNPFPDMNTNVKNVMSLSHDSGLGSVSEPSDDTPSESGDSEILKSTLKSNCKDDNSKLFDNTLYVMHEHSDGAKISTSNYTFPGSSISSTLQQQQLQQIGNSQISTTLQSNSLSTGLIGTRQVQQSSSTQVPSSAAGRELFTSATTTGQLVLSSWTTTTASSSTVPAANAVSTASSQLPPSPNITKVLVPNVPSTQITCSPSVSQLSTSLHSYFTTSPSAISSCNATVSSVFDSRPFCAHLTTSQVTPEHLTTMASQQGSLAASTTWCNPIIPLCAKMAGGLPGGESSISKEQLKPLTTGSITNSNSSISLVSSQGKHSLPVASTCALTTTSSSSSPPPAAAASSVLDQSPKPSVGKSLSLMESLDTTQPICHHALSTLTFPALSNDLDKAGLSQELSKLTESKSTDFSSCGSEKLNSLINTDTTTTLLYPVSRTYSTWKSNATFSHLLPSDVSDHINKSIVSEEFGQRKMQVDCNNGLNGGIFLSQPGEAKEIEISVCGSIKDTSSPSVSDKCTVMEKTTVQVTVADLSNIPSGGLSAILSSNSATIDPCITSSSNSGSSSVNNSTCTVSIAPACTINSLKSVGGMSCQDSAKGSNITSIYTKRSSSTAVSTVNCLPHLYAPDLPLPKRLTESVQRLVKPIPSSDHSLPRVRKSPVSSSIRQQTASTSTSPRSSPHHGKHTSLGSPRAQTVVDHIITSSHASVSPLSSSLPSSQNSWAVPSHTSAPQLSTMHNITQSLPPPQVSFVHSTMAQITSSDQQPFPQVHTGENLVTPASLTTVSAAAMVLGANRLSLSNLEPQQLAVDVTDNKATEASERVPNSFDVPISLNTTRVLPQQLFPTDTSTPSTTTVLAAVVPESQHCDLSRKFDSQVDDQVVSFITSSASKGSISSSSATNTITPIPSSHTADMIHGKSVSFVDSVGTANIAITSIEATSPTYVTAVANQVNLITATIAGQSSTLAMLTNEPQQLSNSCVSQSMCLNLENAGLQSGAINSDSSSSSNMLGGETNNSNINNNNNNNNTSITVPSSDNSNSLSGQQGISSLQGEVCSSQASKAVSEQLSSSATITASVTSLTATSPSGGAHHAPPEGRLGESVHLTVQDNGKRSIENSADKSDKRLRIVVECEKTSDISPMETSCSSISVTNASDSDSAMTCLEVAAPVLGGASVQESSSTLSSTILTGDAAAMHSNMEVDTLNHAVCAVNSGRTEATNASHPNPEFLQLSGPTSLGNGKPHHLLEHSLRERDNDANRAATNASGAADGGVDPQLKDFGATLDSNMQDTSLQTMGHRPSQPAVSAADTHGTGTTISTTTLNTTTTHKTSESNSIVCNDVQNVETTSALTMADSTYVAINDCQHEQQQSLTRDTPVQMDGIEHNVKIADGDQILTSSNVKFSQAAVTSVEAGAKLQDTDKKENLVSENCIPSLDSMNNQEAIENSATKPNESGIKGETSDSKEPHHETKPQPLRRGRPVAERNVSSSTRERSPVRVRNKLCDAAATSTAEHKEELPNEPLKRSTRGSTRPKGFSGVRSRCPLGCEDHKSATPPRVAPPPPPPPHTTTTTPGPGCAASKNLALPRGVDTSAPIYQIKCGTNDAVHLVTTDKD